MEKGKEFIYLWFINILDKNNIEAMNQYNSFTKSNTINIKISKLVKYVVMNILITTSLKKEKEE